MVSETPFSITNASGETIHGDFRRDEAEGVRPALVICHGFTAHKDWGPFPHAGRRFAELGFASVVFNFSHNGIGRNFRKFTELGKFARNTIGKEVEDLRAVVGALAEGKLGKGIVDPEKIGAIGHSRGGGVAVLAASTDPRIRGVAAWSSVSTFYRYTPHQKALWEEQGYLPVKIKGVESRLRFGIDVLRDLEANRDAYDLPQAVRALRVPLLLLHGSADVSVKPKEPEELFAVADKRKTEYVLLEGVGHSFGATHPYRDNPTVDHVVDLTARWFHLSL
jgi:dipeptidyl aminopeptidase/acylaminoacyl peptidase